MDWRDPPVLRAPQLARRLVEAGDRERLARAKPRKGKKNHSVNRERSREASARAKKAADNAAAAKVLRKARRTRARAYWRG